MMYDEFEFLERIAVAFERMATAAEGQLALAKVSVTIQQQMAASSAVLEKELTKQDSQ